MKILVLLDLELSDESLQVAIEAGETSVCHFKADPKKEILASRILMSELVWALEYIHWPSALTNASGVIEEITFPEEEETVN